jgi:hypothetical protein
MAGTVLAPQLRLANEARRRVALELGERAGAEQSDAQRRNMLLHEALLAWQESRPKPS